MQLLIKIFSIIFLINTLLLFLRGNFTFGLLIMILLTTTFICISIFYDKIIILTQTGLLFYLKIILLSFVLVYICFISYILICSKNNTTYTEDVVIILGTGVNNDGTPSKTLQKRLDKAIEYYHVNNDCFIVVSGAKNKKSPISEAQSMYNYLIAHNIPSTKIILEENATSTKENFLFSLKKLSELNINYNNVVFITNAFHVYRSQYYANYAGFNNITHLSTPADYIVFIPALIRESLAILAMLIFNI